MPLKTNHKLSPTDHRSRMRQRFERSGFDGFHDYEVLEFVLFYIFRRGDTKPKAKALIEKFGSFSRAFDASVDDIASVDGMGYDSAVAFKALRNALAYYFEDLAKSNMIKIDSAVSFNTAVSLFNFVRAVIGDKAVETLLVLLLNAKGELLFSTCMGEGNLTYLAASQRNIAEQALRRKAASVVIAHNHPGGSPNPSDSDLTFTVDLKKSLELVEVALLEHIIISDNSFFSFKAAGYL